MQYKVLYPGSNAMLWVALEENEWIRAEAGCMVAKSNTIQIEGRLEGGLIKSFQRAAFAREPFFFQSLKAVNGQGQVLISPSELGDMRILPLHDSQDYYIQAGAFIAAIGEVEITTQLQHISKGLLSGLGLFVLQVSGTGNVAISSLGALHEVTIAHDEEFLVDNGHLVAWSGDTSYQIEPAARSWISSFITSEFFVCRFFGPGKVWIQSRSPQAFSSWINKLVPRKAWQ